MFCPAKAYIYKIVDPENTGCFIYDLVKLVGEHSHPANQAAVLAEGLIVKMVAMMHKHPDSSAPKIRETVLLEAKKEFKNSPELWDEINAAIGSDINIDKRITYARGRLLGKQPKNRDDLDARAFCDSKRSR